MPVDSALRVYDTSSRHLARTCTLVACRLNDNFDVQRASYHADGVEQRSDERPEVP